MVPRLDARSYGLPDSRSGQSNLCVCQTVTSEFSAARQAMRHCASLVEADQRILVALPTLVVRLTKTTRLVRVIAAFDAARFLRLPSQIGRSASQQAPVVHRAQPARVNELGTSLY